MAEKENVNFVERKDLITEVKAIQVFSVSVIFSAAAVASSLVFIFIPKGNLSAEYLSISGISLTREGSPPDMVNEAIL